MRPLLTSELRVGLDAHCALLENEEATDETVPVRILEIRRDGRTNEPQSARVRVLRGKAKTIWVQVQYLRIPDESKSDKAAPADDFPRESVETVLKDPVDNVPTETVEA